MNVKVNLRYHPNRGHSVTDLKDLVRRMFANDFYDINIKINQDVSFLNARQRPTETTIEVEMKSFNNDDLYVGQVYPCINRAVSANIGAGIELVDMHLNVNLPGYRH